jgi:beta-glucanase (GH16 family)
MQAAGHGGKSSPPTHVAAAPIPPGVIQPKGAPDFSATFTGSRLDTSLWATCYPWMDQPTGCNNSGNVEYQWFLPSQARVSGGLLHLDAQQAPTAGQAQDGSPQEYACRSGMVTSYPGFRFKYGYLQVVARFPSSPGLWPALWLAAADLHWPPEIDIIEGWDQITPFTAVYFHPAGAKFDDKLDKALIPPQQAIGWHSFAVSWTKMQVTWLLDGKVVLTVRQHVPHVKMYLIADLAERYPVHAAQCHGSMLIRSVKYWKN